MAKPGWWWRRRRGIWGCLEPWTSGGDHRYIDKAHRRGKVGWDVGKHIEVIPHYRRPHMALVWTGHGRVVPKIVPRRGSVVHREVVAKLPSGFEGITR